MRSSILAISALSLAVCIGATTLQPILAHRVRAVSAAWIGQGLERRQIGVASEPALPQCTSACNPVNSEVSLGCPVTACCTATFETEYFNCLECVGVALNTTDFTSAQNALNLLYTTCVDMGYYLPQLALPGQTPSGASSSAGAGAASTGSVAPSATAHAVSSNGAPSTTRHPATGAAISRRGVQPELLTGAAVLLGVVELW